MTDFDSAKAQEQLIKAGQLSPPSNGQYSPQDFDLPASHIDWRDKQLDTVIWWHYIRNLDPDTVITEAPTGSGKSVYPAALSTSKRTVVVTHTKNLQDSYADYGAAVLYGRSNYSCILDRSVKADQCQFAEQGMHRCPKARACSYLLAKHKAYSAKFVAINYAYWLTAKGFHDTNIGNLVLDECHLLDNVTLGWSGVTVNDQQRQDWALDRFPLMPRGVQRTSDLDHVHNWLARSGKSLQRQWKTLQKQADQGIESARDLARKCERLGGKIRSAYTALEHVKSAWFVRSGPGKVWVRGRPMPGLILKPLTPKYHYKRLFVNGGSWQTYAMSATVGGFAPFSTNLGLTCPASWLVPNQWPASSRPVYLLDCPKMTRASANKDPSIYTKQADSIASAILAVDHSWSGFVHVTRKKEAGLLADRLAKRGLADRVWVPPERNTLTGLYYGTQDQARLWQERLVKVPNSIMICWQFWAGYDGRQERISIIAKVPFPFYGDEYERERLKYDHSMYNLRAALRLMQACGRTRRGALDDYDTPDQRHGLVAIADASLPKIKKYLSQDFVESLTEWSA